MRALRAGVARFTPCHICARRGQLDGECLSRVIETGSGFPPFPSLIPNPELLCKFDVRIVQSGV